MCQKHRLSQIYAKWYKTDIQTQSFRPSSTPSSPVVLGGRVKRNGRKGINIIDYRKNYANLIFKRKVFSPIFYPIVPRPRGTSETKWDNTAAISRKGVKIIEYIAKWCKIIQTWFSNAKKVFSHLLPHRPPSSGGRVKRNGAIQPRFLENVSKSWNISQNYAKSYKLDFQTQSLLPSSTPSSPVLGGRVKRNGAIQPRYLDKVSKS